MLPSQEIKWQQLPLDAAAGPGQSVTRWPRALALFPVSTIFNWSAARWCRSRWLRGWRPAACFPGTAACGRLTASSATDVRLLVRDQTGVDREPGFELDGITDQAVAPAVFNSVVRSRLPAESTDTP